MTFAGGGVGVFGATVWPTHVGVLMADGREPWDCPDYKRQQIAWDTIDGRIIGRATAPVLVPVGDVTHMLFSHHPTSPLIAGTKKFNHPLIIVGTGGEIEILGITEDDFMPAKTL